MGWGVRRFHNNIHIFSNPIEFGRSRTPSNCCIAVLYCCATTFISWFLPVCCLFIFVPVRGQTLNFVKKFIRQSVVTAAPLLSDAVAFTRINSRDHQRDFYDGNPPVVELLSHVVKSQECCLSHTHVCASTRKTASRVDARQVAGLLFCHTHTQKRGSIRETAAYPGAMYKLAGGTVTCTGQVADCT